MGLKMVRLKYDMTILKKEDVDFPWRLKGLPDCPDIIFALGNIKILNNFSIAVVGSRLCNEYGIRVTNKIVEDLTNRGICIVSGLAEGIDTYAHRAAIRNNGKTIAVIGNGFENIYPYGNAKLVNEIIEKGGAIISEYFPDQAPLSFCFPHRNRLVACMTEGTLVTQAREDSGALITANLAMKYGKKVFAVPGDITDKKCFGSNRIINCGAKLVRDVNDILAEYSCYNFPIISNNQQTEIKVPDEKYNEIYKTLESGPMHINEICKKTDKSIQMVLSDLTMLEMQGFIEILPGEYYKIV